MESADKIIAEICPLLSTDNVDIWMIPKFEQQLVHDVCVECTSILKKGTPLIKIPNPCAIVGDIHGNFLDLLKIFREFGTPEFTKYLFLGDFVDRGLYSTPVLAVICSFFLKYPENVYMIRGNHEFAHINKMYGFHNEIMKLYKNEDLWADFQIMFSYLPFAAIICKKVFCVHGGLSPMLHSVEDINLIELPVYDYDQPSLISDLVWSDPSDKAGFSANDRGSGMKFGHDTITSFLSNNHLQLLVRGHQVTAEGVTPFASNLGVTVFSSSGYCTMMQNCCGVITMKSAKEFVLHSLTPKGDKKSNMKLVPRMLGLRRALNTNIPPKVVKKDLKLTVDVTKRPVSVRNGIN